MAEHDEPLRVRATRASDGDLARVESLLRTAADADTAPERQALRGHISRIVVDTWSFDAPLSAALVTFDDRFLLP